MVHSEITVLRRAHQMFAGSTRFVTLGADTAQYGRILQQVAGLNVGAGHAGYQNAIHHSRQALTLAARTDSAVAGIVASAQHDHAQARELTGHVLDEARADAVATRLTPLMPLAQREAMRRRVMRLRAQRAHVLLTGWRARRHLTALRALHYRMSHHPRRGLTGLRLPAPNSCAGIAVHAALSRLGRPYVWGATGPDQFDCSGLVQWSYAQAGIHLDRTTYQQINDGIPVPRWQVRPGDLVFPHAGHVQMAIGNNLVVEAPYSGASVRISSLGGNVQVRRPV